MTEKSNKNSEKQAHIVLSGEMRPLLDKVQETFETESWKDTVEKLLEHFVESKKSKVNNGEFGSMEKIAELKEQAVSASIKKIAESLQKVFAAADLKIDKKSLTEALDAAAANSNPAIFAEFAIDFVREIEQTQNLHKNFETQTEEIKVALGKIEKRFEKIEQALLDRKPPQITVKNAAADADADSDSD